MSRYALAVGLIALVGASGLAQVPITGAYPPWSPPSPQPPLAPPLPPPFPPAPAILQPAPPYYVPVPSGQVLTGYFKMDAYLVGGRNLYPYDSGEFNLAGYAGNARYYGVFCITLPPPDQMDPASATVYYWTCPWRRK